MQVHEPRGEDIELPRQQAIPDPCDFYSPSDEVSRFGTPHGTLTAVLSTIALTASFGLGWAGGQVWPEIATALGLRQPAQTEAASLRVAKSGPTTKHACVPKPTSASASQALPSLNVAPGAGSMAVARAPSESTGTVSPASQ